MLKLVLPALAAATVLAATARADVSAADAAALTQPVQHLVDAINQASATPPKDTFAKGSVVLDDFPPYHWTGKTDGIGWYKALAGATAKEHADFVAMKAVVKIGEPAFARIDGDNAYVVFPSTFDFTEDGSRKHQMAQWLFVEEKVKGQWLIAGHTWAITAEVPAGP